ncbi:SixA phosphatase family protein [Jannaschia sp. CCS1]|uniref:SixA phosphatase family protein n=1 Tax=Jannaschia sp. (strain CCS1) TaxID=290400 RepID=UPI000053DBBC|nr:histidine phosphatase family protein [Jannaschia sp. CCS1]ABD53548.1 putative phosphohistidine phosphatase SixA [Jannaschia sp. CCS1]
MSRTLILIRHCKSDWTTDAPTDHDRVLNPRGRRDAPRIGAWLAARDLIPDTVLCSDAQRTQETWERIATRLPSQPPVSLSHALYLAEPAAMLHAIRKAAGKTVALVGHCPGILTLAWDLAAMPVADPDFGAYPTGAVTVFDFDDATWGAVEQGEIRAFVTPRSLPDPA